MAVFCLKSARMHWEINPPRPSRLSSGLREQNPHPREIFWSSGDVFPNTSLFSTVNRYNVLIRSVFFNVCALTHQAVYIRIQTGIVSAVRVNGWPNMLLWKHIVW